MCDINREINEIDYRFSDHYKDYYNPLNEKGFYNNMCVLCGDNSEWGKTPRISPVCSECREEFNQQIIN